MYNEHSVCMEDYGNSSHSQIFKTTQFWSKPDFVSFLAVFQNKVAAFFLLLVFFRSPHTCCFEPIKTFSPGFCSSTADLLIV